MGKTKFKQKYAPGDAGKKTRASASAKAPKASSKRRAQPEKQTSTASWLKNTLLPKKKMDIQLKSVMATLHEREKLTDEDFKKVKTSIIHQSYGLFTLSALWTAASFYLLFEQKFNPMGATVQAGVGCIALFANLLGILGAKFESDNLLISYLSLMTCLVLVTLLVGTYGLVSTSQSVREYELALARGSTLALSSTVTPQQLGTLSYLIGALSIIQVPLQGYSVKNAGRMLTTMRAVTNFMETLTILMFPIGLFFVAGGVYIVNSTGGDPTSAITALAIFAVGCFIIGLSILGYFGTIIHSRGMLLLFQWPVLISIVFLFGFGIWATIQADVVAETLDEYWVDIRKFLPPTFEGRYDKELFGQFVETNLQMVAYGCFYTGIFFLFCSFGAGLMRQEIRTEHIILKAAEKELTMSLEREEQRREEQQSVMRLEQSGLSHSQAVQQSSIKYKKNKIGHMRKFERAHKSEIHKRWKKAWKNGSQFSRCMTKVGCATVCLILIVVVACGLAFLVYASFCEGLESTCLTQTMTPTNNLPSTIYLNSQYKRGTILIGAGSNANAFKTISGGKDVTLDVVSKTNDNTNIAFVMQSCSLDNGFEKGIIVQDEEVLDQLKYTISKYQGKAPEFFGIDKSCQKALIGLAIPKNIIPRLNVTTNAMLNIIGSENLMLREVSLVGKTASATMKKIHLDYEIRENDDLHRAMYINSDLGEVKIGDEAEVITTGCVDWGKKSTKESPNTLFEHGIPYDPKCHNQIACNYDSTIYPVPSLSFESINGFVTVANTQLSNCDIHVKSHDSAPTKMKNVVLKCTSKHCLLNNKIDITSTSGSVDLDSIVADSIAIRTQKGRVSLKHVSQLNSETGITVTTGRGNMELTDLVASGNIQLESKEGNIVLKIPMCGKYPAFMGTFQIAHAPFQNSVRLDTIEKSYKQIFSNSLARVATDLEWNSKKLGVKLTTTERETKSILIDTAGSFTEGIITGTIGCHLPTTGSICPYSNELLITTETGSVDITIDECRNICGKNFC